MVHPLTKYRTDHKLTLDAFAQKVGVSKSMVFKWENGTVPRRNYARLIEKVTKGAVTPTDFFEQHLARAG